jgi:hypothetical protein
MDKNKYAKIAFRIAEQCIPHEFQDEIPCPVFLTSANKSGFPEAYTGDEVTGIFLFGLIVSRCLIAKYQRNFYHLIFLNLSEIILK